MTTSLFGLVDLKHPLEFAPSQPLTRERWESMWREYKRMDEERLNRPNPRLFVSRQTYEYLKACGYPPPKPLDAKARVDRARNRRKLKTAQRMLKNAKNESQRAMARSSVAMLQEMLR